MLTPIEPKVEDTGRYSMTQGAKILEINRSTLLRLTKAGRIKCGYRENGYKFYEGKEIKRYWRAKL